MDSKQAAADALMEALEDWARSLGEAGVRRSDGARYCPSRQIDRTMRTAHREGRLFEALTEWLPSYHGLRTTAGGDAYANRMRDIVEHGCPLWESVVAEVGRPWSAYITDQQRQMLHRVVADVHADRPWPAPAGEGAGRLASSTAHGSLVRRPGRVHGSRRTATPLTHPWMSDAQR